MALVSAHDREAAGVALRRHYVSGRLSPDELGERLQLALGARTRRELGSALAGLPPLWRDRDELRRIGRAARRGVVWAALTLVWSAISLVLLVAFAVSAIMHGLTAADTLVFPLVWLGATLAAVHLGRRA